MENGIERIIGSGEVSDESSSVGRERDGIGSVLNNLGLAILLHAHASVALVDYNRDANPIMPEFS